jgi:hypothetical protein
MMTDTNHSIVAAWVLIAILAMLFPPMVLEWASFQRRNDTESEHPSAVISTHKPLAFFPSRARRAREPL